MKATTWLRLGVASLIAATPLSASAARFVAAKGGVVHALVVGVNDYPNLPGQSLRGARPDAEDLAAVLKKGGVADLKVLIDREATRAHFIMEMNRLIATAKPGDLVIISYSGHGTQVPEYDNWKGLNRNGADEQIVLSGFGFKGPAINEAIVNVEVRAWLARLDAKGVDTVVLWDSCFGGGMRDVDPHAADIQTRRVKRPASADVETRFPAIDMTSAEARAEVKAMTHVTFLAGATDDSVVPEMPNIDPKNPSVPRGALSFYVARAVEGQLKGGPVSRLDLFKYLKQNVSEATAKRQVIEVQPQAKGDPSISGREVFAVETGAAPTPTPTVASTPTPTPTPAPTDAAATPGPAPVRLAIVDGPANAFDTIVKRVTPLQLVADRAQAELVWNVAENKAYAQGDMLMENIDGSMIGAIADRVRALSRLQAVGANRPLEVSLNSGGALLTPGRNARVEVAGVAGAKLVVFNIAADSTVQMLLPAAPDSPAACPSPGGESWACPLDVVAPFGVDTLVAIASANDSASLLDWLRAHVDKQAAAELPDVVADLIGKDPTAKVGFTAVVTRAAPP